MIDEIKAWFNDTYQSIITWFGDIIESILNWFESLPLDLYEYFLKGMLQTFNTFQPPQFITDGLQSTVSMLPPDIGYFLAMSGLAQGLAIYGTAVVARMIKKIIPFWR